MLRRCRSDVIRFAHSDVLRRWRKVMWCVPYSRAKRTLQGEAVITHEVRITFRLRNTSFQKRKSSPLDCFFVFGCGSGICCWWSMRGTNFLRVICYSSVGHDEWRNVWPRLLWRLDFKCCYALLSAFLFARLWFSSATKSVQRAEGREAQSRPRKPKGKNSGPPKRWSRVLLRKCSKKMCNYI